MALPSQWHLFTVSFICFPSLTSSSAKKSSDGLLKTSTLAAEPSPCLLLPRPQHVRKGISTRASWERSCPHYLSWVTVLIFPGRIKPVRLPSLKVSTVECCTFSSNDLQLSWPFLCHCTAKYLHPGTHWPYSFSPEQRLKPGLFPELCQRARQRCRRQTWNLPSLACRLVFIPIVDEYQKQGVILQGGGI